MARKWDLTGPDQDMMWFDEVARLFGYSASHLRQMIDEGRFPSPLGEGNNTYYTGEDVAAIRHLLGRWRPKEAPGKSGKSSETRGKSGKSEEDEGS